MPIKSPKQLSEAASDAIKNILEDYQGPRKLMETAVTQAVIKALTEELLVAKIRPFKKISRRYDIDQFFECIVWSGCKNRSGYLRQVKTTVKRKGKKVVTSHFEDAQGLKIPVDIAEAFIY